MNVSLEANNLFFKNALDKVNFYLYKSKSALILQQIMPPWWISGIIFTLIAVYFNDTFLYSLVSYFWCSVVFIFGICWFNLSKKNKKNVILIYFSLMSLNAIYGIIPIVNLISGVQFFFGLLGSFLIAWLLVVMSNKAFRISLDSKLGLYLYFGIIAFCFFSPTMSSQAQVTVNTLAACNTGGIMGNLANFTISVFSGITFTSVGGTEFSSFICQVIAMITISLAVAFIGACGYAGVQIGIQQQPPTVALNPVLGFVLFAGASALIIGVMVGTGTTNAPTAPNIPPVN